MSKKPLAYYDLAIATARQVTTPGEDGPGHARAAMDNARNHAKWVERDGKRLFDKDRPGKPELTNQRDILIIHVLAERSF